MPFFPFPRDSRRVKRHNTSINWGIELATFWLEDDRSTTEPLVSPLIKNKSIDLRKPSETYGS